VAVEIHLDDRVLDSPIQDLSQSLGSVRVGLQISIAL
jgi:hypothetical protein